MRTVTKTYTVYKFSELSDKAKERARMDLAALDTWCRDREYMASIQALARHFGGTVEDYSISWDNTSPSYMDFDMPEMDRDEIGALLDKLGSYNPETLKGKGECKLTGCGTDEDAIDGFRVAFIGCVAAGNPVDLDRLMQDAFKTWLKAAHEEYEYNYSDSGFGETADANEWEFLESGKMI